MATIVRFPRKPEHLEAEFDRLIAEFSKAVDPIIKPDASYGLELLRRHAVLYSLVKEIQAGE